MANAKLGSAYPFIVQKDGMAVVHPDQTMVMNPDKSLLRSANTELQNAVMRMVASETGDAHYTMDKVYKEVYFAPIPTTKWSVAINANDQEIDAPPARNRLPQPANCRNWPTPSRRGPKT